MTVASLGSYVAASYNNPYMSESIYGSGYTGGTYGVDDNGTSIFYKNKQTSSGVSDRNSTDAAGNYGSIFQDIQDKLKNGCTSDAIESFDSVVELIKNENPYYNLTDEQARNYAEQAYAKAMGTTLGDDIDTYIDTASERADKASSWFNFGDDNIQWDLTAEETRSLMLNGKEYDQAKLDAESKKAKRNNAVDKWTTGLIVGGTATAACVLVKGLAGIVGSLLFGNPVGWLVVGATAVILGAKAYKNHCNKQDAEEAKKAQANS